MLSVIGGHLEVWINLFVRFMLISLVWRSFSNSTHR